MMCCIVPALRSAAQGSTALVVLGCCVPVGGTAPIVVETGAAMQCVRKVSSGCASGSSLSVVSVMSVVVFTVSSCIVFCCRASLSGYFCRNGTGRLSPSIACLNSTEYCPAGSSEPVPTSFGYYAIATSTRQYFNQSMCEAGRYCIGGVAQACEAGRYGALRGMNDSMCSGECDAGYFCDAGSWSATQDMCGYEALYCPQVLQYRGL